MVMVWHAQKAKNKLHRELPSPDFGEQKESGADEAEYCLYKQPDDEQEVFHLTIVSGVPMFFKVANVRDIFRHHQKGESAIPVGVILHELLKSGSVNFNRGQQGGIFSAFTVA